MAHRKNDSLKILMKIFLAIISFVLMIIAFVKCKPGESLEVNAISFFSMLLGISIVLITFPKKKISDNFTEKNHCLYHHKGDKND